MGKTKFLKTKPKKGESRTEYNEAKERCNLTLTPTAIASLDTAATALGISRSELIERLGRKGEAWLVEAGKESHMGATPEEQLEKNQGAMRWAEARIRDIREGKQCK